MRIVGLMSGTSADGVDACLAHIEDRDGRPVPRVEDFLTVPYDEDLRGRVLGCRTVGEVCRLNVELGERFANAALALCEAAGVSPADVDAVGSHGQTVCHVDEPEAHATLQIGEPSVIAERTGITTVADFRPRDVAAGGRGAPLVPIVDHLLLADETTDRVALNLGGIANVTVLPAGGSLEDVVAFDTGPGNMVIDGVMEVMTQGHKTCDRDGQLAARGTVREGAVTLMLEHPYFAAPPPKSAGRETFGLEFARTFTLVKKSGRESRADVAATATAFTARSIADAIGRWAFDGPCQVIASGGGVHNRTLMACLAEFLPQADLCTSEGFGIDPDAKEALAFAVLAWLTLHGRPGNVPSATGARRPAVLGKIVPGRDD
jgi:anhydro-N-acetylmuramic acid kinase